jgi:hypothetical protein
MFNVGLGEVRRTGWPEYFINLLRSEGVLFFRPAVFHPYPGYPLANSLT